ncbi:unnamed protein product [Paramecium octaurelia]|uniref:Uncharacterized protein n=1 Tax=Paramecium octaurelia TaxID=43137 RepID=A0A8S1X9J6_PAROT|nr:unnamed protein product [Paramecium octaurelia]
MWIRQLLFFISLIIYKFKIYPCEQEWRICEFDKENIKWRVCNSIIYSFQYI